MEKLLDFIKTLGIAFIIAFTIRSFVLHPFTVPSSSMEKTILPGDYLFVKKFSYGMKIPFTDYFIYEADGPKDGDIVVFDPPAAAQSPMEAHIPYFIKRVIGVPGDVLEMRDKQLFRNKKLVYEPYAQYVKSDIVEQRDNWGPIIVPERKYFMSGDNRDDSYDSRFWGFVDRNKITGKAWVIFFSCKEPWYKMRPSNILWSRIFTTLK